MTDGSGKAVSYVYDEADNLQEIAYPDGTKVTYEYDLNDNLTKVTDRKGKATAYKHDALNRVTEVIRPNGTKTVTSYDAEDHVTKLVNTCGICGKEMSSYEYKYNDQGYIVGETAVELEAGTRKEPSWEDWYNWGGQKVTEESKCCHEEKTVKTNRTYEYDENWELIRSTEKVEGGKTTVHNYTYDKIGNRKTYEKIENGVQKEKYKYEYNASNQLVKKVNCKIWGDTGVKYQYDDDGNLICTSENDYTEPVTYEYNAENRLSVVKQGGTVLMAALYDGDQNRVFQIDNTYNWEDCYGDEVVIPEAQRTEGGNSAKEQLVSILPNGVNSKGYTLTQYVNDVNRENTEALMEYSADEKVRQAYTYGDTRLSVDKSEETSYYLNDGRGSVTGLLTEAGKLSNSYRYDPYGSLTSGTPDAVNYYGYNAESTNTNTGFQYLRARYYSPATGTFTTQDTDLGTKENPLTRNRYDYVTNNPLNYEDPTGHSLWSKIKKAANKVVKTVKKAVNKVVKTVKKAVKSAVNWVSNAFKKTKQTIQDTTKYIQKTASNAYHSVTSAGSRFVKSVGNGIRSAGRTVSRTFTSFKHYAAVRTAEIRETVVRELCTTANRISDALGKVDWKTVGKIAVGGLVIAGLGVATVLTGGAAAGVVGAIASGAFTGAAIGGGTGALIGGLSNVSQGKGFLEGAADGFMWGTIGGAVSGGVGAGTAGASSGILNNKIAQEGIKNAADTLVNTADDLAHGRDVSLGSVAKDFGTGMLVAGISSHKSNATSGVVDDTPKTYQTYTKTNSETGKVYSGRTSGTGTPAENVAKRDKNHHMNTQGYGPAKIDKSSVNKDAIRGREQQLIDIYGGARSDGGTSGNAIKGISKNNPKAEHYMDEANKEFNQ